VYRLVFIVVVILAVALGLLVGTLNSELVQVDRSGRWACSFFAQPLSACFSDLFSFGFSAFCRYAPGFARLVARTRMHQPAR
jgi:hypothetical protein